MKRIVPGPLWWWDPSLSNSDHKPVCPGVSVLVLVPHPLLNPSLLSTSPFHLSVRTIKWTFRTVPTPYRHPLKWQGLSFFQYVCLRKRTVGTRDFYWIVCVQGGGTVGVDFRTSELSVFWRTGLRDPSLNGRFVNTEGDLLCSFKVPLRPKVYHHTIFTFPTCGSYNCKNTHSRSLRGFPRWKFDSPHSWYSCFPTLSGKSPSPFSPFLRGLLTSRTRRSSRELKYITVVKGTTKSFTDWCFLDSNSTWWHCEKFFNYLTHFAPFSG